MELVEIVDNRRVIMDNLLSLINTTAGRQHQLSDIKKLILAITYGGSVKKHLRLLGCNVVPGWLGRFQQCIREIANKLGHANPGKIEILQELGKRDPTISMLSYIGMDLQRQTTDRMRAAAEATGGRVVSFERDCIVVVGKVDSGKVREAAAIPITEESYEPEEMVAKQLKQKFPFLDFCELGG